MKLAEALQERADLNRRIEQLRIRLANNALVQEGEAPAESPNELIRELDGCISRLEKLMAEINLTNCKTTVGGKTLTELIAEKDALTLKISHYRSLIDAASRVVPRATRSEIKIVSAVDVHELQKKTDEMSKQLRLLDNTIQQTNWTTEL